MHGLLRVESCRNSNWLDGNVDGIYDTIVQNWHNPGYQDEAIQNLLVVFPYVLNRPDLKRWGILLSDIVRALPVQIRERGAKRVHYQIGSHFLLSKEQKPPLPTQKRKSRMTFRGTDMHTHYIVLFALHFYRKPTMFQREQIDDLLAISRSINSDYLYWKTYQLVALLLATFDERYGALTYGCLAYYHWEKQHEMMPNELTHLEIGYSSKIVANVYYSDNQIEQAILWSRNAAEHLTRVEVNLQEGDAYRLIGIVGLQTGRPETALPALHNSLEKFELANSRRDVVITHYLLGATHAYLRNAEQAQIHFNKGQSIIGQKSHLLMTPVQYTLLVYISASFYAYTGNHDSVQHMLAQVQMLQDAISDDRIQAMLAHGERHLRHVLETHQVLEDFYIPNRDQFFRQFQRNLMFIV